MSERTARLNALRGLLRELGVFIPVGAEQVVPAVWALIEDANADLPDALRPLFADACLEIRDIEARIKKPSGNSSSWPNSSTPSATSSASPASAS
jgi:transposase